MIATTNGYVLDIRDTWRPPSVCSYPSIVDINFETTKFQLFYDNVIFLKINSSTTFIV